MSGADYITLLQSITNKSIKKKIGKRYFVNNEGKLDKKSTATHVSYQATTLKVENVTELSEIIKNCSEHEAIILGFIKGTEDGTPYTLKSESELRNELDMVERPIGLFKIDDELCAGRFKENYTYSSWLLIDRDIADDIPDVLKTTSPEDYLHQLSTVIPDIENCSRLVVPSSSSRIVSIEYDDQNDRNIDNCHIYLQVKTPDDIPRFRKDLQIKLFANKLGYAKLNSIGVGMRRTILDLSVMSPERIVFEARPFLLKSARADYKIIDPEFRLYDDVDNMHYKLDTESVTISTDEKKRVASLYQMFYNDIGSDSNVDINVAGLRLDMEIHTKTKGIMTVEEYLADHEGEKLRCQTTPFRESSSWNGILHVDHDMQPHLFDNGTHTLYVLPKKELEAPKMKTQLAETYGGQDALDAIIKKLQGEFSNVSDPVVEETPPVIENTVTEVARAETMQVQTESTWEDVHEEQFDEPITGNIISGDGLSERRLAKDYKLWHNEDNVLPWDLDLLGGVNIIDNTYHKKCPITDNDLEMVMANANNEDFPLATRTNQGTLTPSQKCTVRQVRYAMNSACYSVRYNQMTDQQEYKMPVHRMLIEQGKEELIRDVNYQDQMIVEACSYLNMVHKAKIVDAVDAIARDNQFHPWREWIDAVEWDGVDRSDKILDTIQLIDNETEAELKQIYLHRFSLQVIEGLYAKAPDGLRMCLTFSGAQQIGKTEWFKWFIGGRSNREYSFFKASFNVSGTSKDSEMMEANRKFVLVELGELDATFRKADIAHVKGFISRDTDSYRAPYARKTQTSPRRVVYCATVNDKEFLADRSGNTRFPTLGVKDLDWKLMEQMSVSGELQQFWAQRKVEWNEGERHHMTDEEKHMQEANEGGYMMENHAEEVLREYFDEIMDNTPDRWGAVTVNELLDYFHLTKTGRKDVKAFMIATFGQPSGRNDRYAVDKQGNHHNIRKRSAFYAPLGEVNGMSNHLDKIKAGIEIEKNKKREKDEAKEREESIKLESKVIPIDGNKD